MFVLLSFTTSCGIKPDRLPVPDGADSSAYPRTYPDIETDYKNNQR